MNSESRRITVIFLAYFYIKPSQFFSPPQGDKVFEFQFFWSKFISHSKHLPEVSRLSWRVCLFVCFSKIREPILLFKYKL